MTAPPSAVDAPDTSTHSPLSSLRMRKNPPPIDSGRNRWFAVPLQVSRSSWVPDAVLATPTHLLLCTPTSVYDAPAVNVMSALTTASSSGPEPVTHPAPPDTTARLSA